MNITFRHLATYGLISLSLSISSAIAFDIDKTTTDETLKKSVDYGNTETSKMDAEYKYRLSQKRASSEGSAGGLANCNSIHNDYPLYQYCDIGSCDGFTNELYLLCKYGDASSLKNQNFYLYIQNGDLGAFTKDIDTFNAAKKSSNTFLSRKRFLIYYLRGYKFK